MLSAINVENPLFWALMIGWILSVVLHEFAHGLVGYLGGDYTLRERGGLSLNPLQYIDPVTSLLIPAVMLAMGGIPLPGGATYIRRDLLRSRAWDSLVSLAGPAMNLLIFLGCAIPLHPSIGWADYTAPSSTWTTAQLFLGAMATLQFWAILLNLAPIPPLDGFGAIGPFMDQEARMKLSMPPVSTFLFLGYFFVIWKVPYVSIFAQKTLDRMLLLLGFGEDGVIYFWNSLVHCLNG
jgi:Zn-dependent protease